MTTKLRNLAAAAAIVAIGACAAAPRADTRAAAPGQQPGTRVSAHERGTDAPDALKRVVARSGAVSSANGLASDAGIAMLRAGGNAIDAAVATAFAIGVVEPQMSGLGGSGAMLVWRDDERQPHYLDFYAMQNAASFRGRTGEIARNALGIVGIPGEVAGLLEAHRRFGTLPLRQVIAPAIRLAEEGFPVGQVLAGFIRSDSAKLHRYPEARAQMWPEGRALEPGAIYRNPALASTLRDIAARGREAFDAGPAGVALISMLNAGGHPATLADLSGSSRSGNVRCAPSIAAASCSRRRRHRREHR